MAEILDTSANIPPPADTLLTSSAKPAVETAQTDEAKVAEQKATELKAAADKEAYDKLSDADKKTFDEKAAADKAAAEEKAKGAPEKYEDFKAPEGFELPPDSLTAFSALAKEHNLSQSAAQKFIDLAASNAKSGADAGKAANDKAWTDARAAWVADIKKDPEVGGANFDKSREYAVRAIEKFGNPAFKEILNTGYGDNPEFFKAFVKIGKALSEDKVVEGSQAPKGEKTWAQRMYPNATQ